MGTVDLVLRSQGQFHRLYAMKRLHSHFRADSELQAMFLDEARLAGLIAHRNVVAVLDLGEDAEGPFFVMDFVSGITMNELIRRHGRGLPVHTVVEIAKQVASGLRCVHELRGVDGIWLRLVHRDISPRNLLVGYDGVVRVTDFGIAKAVGRSGSQTQTGVLKGKLGYASPEQLCFEALDGRSDLFSFGIVLFEMLAGTRLYAAKEHGPHRILNEPPPDVGMVRDDLPPALVELVFDLLAKDRGERVSTARELLERLEIIEADLLLLEPSPVPLDEIVRGLFPEGEGALEETLREATDLLSAGKLPPHGGLPRTGWSAQTLLIGVAGLSLLLMGIYAGRTLWPSSAEVARATQPADEVHDKPVAAPSAVFVAGAGVRDDDVGSDERHPVDASAVRLARHGASTDGLRGPRPSEVLPSSVAHRRSPSSPTPPATDGEPSVTVEASPDRLAPWGFE